MIKAVIFDFGRVICSFDNAKFIEGISKYTDRSVLELREILSGTSKIWLNYEMGVISSNEFFEKVAGMGRLKLSKKQFIKIFSDIFIPIETTYDLVRRLKPNYKLGMLSNTSEWHFEYGIKPVDIFNLFDAVTLSYEIKAMKPDKKLYSDILFKLKAKPEESVFIDDLKENIEGAEAVGIKGVQYLSYEKTIEGLRSLDIKI